MFGSSGVNGKFPNAAYVYTQQRNIANTTTGPDGTVTTSSVDLDPLLLNQALVLES